MGACLVELPVVEEHADRPGSGRLLLQVCLVCQSRYLDPEGVSHHVYKLDFQLQESFRHHMKRWASHNWLAKALIDTRSEG